MSGEALRVSTSEWIKLITIPFFTGAIGWLINWSGLIMLFNPIHFHGRRVPGLYELSKLLPRKLQEVPGIMQGGVGWQGIIPSRAAKMGSIIVDKAIAKLGTAGEFFQELEPDKIADQMTLMFLREIPEIVDDTMRRSSPGYGRTCRHGRRRRCTRASASSCQRSCTRSRGRSGSTSTSCWIPRSW